MIIERNISKDPCTPICCSLLVKRIFLYFDKDREVDIYLTRGFPDDQHFHPIVYSHSSLGMPPSLAPYCCWPLGTSQDFLSHLAKSSSINFLQRSTWQWKLFPVSALMNGMDFMFVLIYFLHFKLNTLTWEHCIHSNVLQSTLSE